MLVSDSIRVVIVDDHPLIQQALEVLLADEEGIELVASATDGASGVDLVVSKRPDVVVMDILMPGVDAFQAVGQMRNLSPDTEVVFLSGSSHDRMLREARRAGALGFVSKADGTAAVVDAIRAAAEGRTFLSVSIVDDGGREGDRLEALSPREHEVLRYIARGFSKKEIGTHMHLSPKTVDRHATSLMSKLDIHDRVELARFAIREGLVSPEM
jgi:DNA-binding NarL/FixJ family response regulator